MASLHPSTADHFRRVTSTWVRACPARRTLLAASSPDHPKDVNDTAFALHQVRGWRGFARYSADARSRGYRTTVHAGEGTPAAYVTVALDTCLPDRIDHGVWATDDAEVARRPAIAGTAPTMCPLSNLALGVVRDLSAHPLRQLLRAGVRVTVNSDEPPFFGGYVNANYIAAAQALALDVDDVITLAHNSFTDSFADPSDVGSWPRRLEVYRDEQRGSNES